MFYLDCGILFRLFFASLHKRLVRLLHATPDDSGNRLQHIKPGKITFQKKYVAVLRRTQNFFSSDILLTNINLSSDIPASYLRHPVTNKYDYNPKEI